MQIFRIAAVALSLAPSIFALPSADVVVARGNAFDEVAAFKELDTRQTQTSAVGVITSSVGVLVANLTSEISALGNATAAEAGVIVADILKSLTAIATSLNATTATIAPALINPILALTPAELAALQKALQALHFAVANLQASLTTVLNSLQKELAQLIKSEVVAVVNLIKPLTDPIIAFAGNITGSVSGTNSLVLGVKIAAAGLLTAVANLLKPVSDLILALFGIKIPS